MGLRIHPRLLKVKEVSAKLGIRVCDLIEEYNLTAIEAVSILLELAQVWNRYALRVERHPDDPTRKADEA